VQQLAVGKDDELAANLVVTKVFAKVEKKVVPWVDWKALIEVVLLAENLVV